MYSVKMRASQNHGHISGAETICEANDIEQTIARYFQKGFQHENGIPDFLNLKIEKVRTPIVQINALPVIDNPHLKLLNLAQKVNITKEAIEQAWRYIRDETCYRGAIIIDAYSGNRIDDFGERGCRATHFCFKQQGKNSLISERVKDALAIASIFQSNEGVVGELCVSDDLNYTTGYFANKEGYHRLYHLKTKGSREGGRVIFVNHQFHLESFLYFCQKQPKCVIY
ncbi:6-carboxyhexanoate--CoA ligase [Staphylococcus hyicus]|uniref:6-carboxyhexanoate--CoA ligase n=1 Tax=Staphylococcus hyicus TaxID=1284 RepID=UPI00208F0926|nr:6-carboxyhexanoate--CoA ligase [Staphylococcus hyicus]MCO4330617.1 6-carboxyhexanoate--CoA ligase [Staphylococcus hyicus]MCO4333015.1 6-carboxyhexanoate--CoA ligase [Staphylococcus hyicus]